MTSSTSYRMNVIYIFKSIFYFLTDSLGKGATTTVVFLINFNDTTQPAKFDLCTQDQKYNVSITAPVGELLIPHTMSDGEFTTQQGNINKITGITFFSVICIISAIFL